jgi:hypothetical protein
MLDFTVLLEPTSVNQANHLQMCKVRLIKSCQVFESQLSSFSAVH